MSDKIRMRLTFVWEYDADPAHYPDRDPYEMAKIDMGGDVYALIGMALAGEDHALTIEPIDATPQS